MKNTVLRICAWLLFPIAAWQVWITDIPNYHLQHILMWLLIPFLVWAWYKNIWKIKDIYFLLIKLTPFLLLILFLQAIAAWQTALELNQANIWLYISTTLLKIICQWPPLLLLLLTAIIFIREPGCSRAVLQGAIVLFFVVFVVFILEAIYVYLRSPYGIPYDNYPYPKDPIIQQILSIIKPILILIGDIEAQWKNTVYSFYHGGSYSLTLPRINGIWEEASIFAANISMLFIPLSAGLLGLSRSLNLKKLRILSIFIFISSCIMLAMCRSTTGQILLIPAICVWTILYINKTNLKKILTYIFVSTCFFLICIALIPQGSTSIIKRLDNYALSSAPRAVITRTSISMIPDYLIVGSGRESYLPLLYKHSEYRKYSSTDPELKAWTKDKTGELSALAAFIVRYGVIITTLIIFFLISLAVKLRRHKHFEQNNIKLNFAVPAYITWLVMCFIILIGAYDPRNALLILPLCFFIAIAKQEEMNSQNIHSNSCCFVMHSYGGGAEKMALLLARELAVKGWTISIVCLRMNHEFIRNVPFGVKFFVPASNGFYRRLCFLGKAKKIIQRSSAVVGTLELQSIFVASIFAPGRAIGWLHKDIKGYFATKSVLYIHIYKSLMKFAIKHSYCIACVSEGILASSRELWPRYRQRFVRLYNPLDIAEIQRLSLEEMSLDVAAFFETHRKVVLAVGRLEEQKNFVLLLEAFFILKSKCPDVALCIAGEGMQRKMLEDKASSLGISVFMPGFVNPYPLMRKASVLALTSFYEGFPLVLLESLALGLPIVAVNCPSGPAEVLENGRFGRLVESDASTIAQALTDTLAIHFGDEERQKLKQRAAFFSIEVQLQRWMELMRASQVGRN